LADPGLTRFALEMAHDRAARACGRLSLILASRRGLSKAVILETATAFRQAADSLMKIVGDDADKGD